MNLARSLKVKDENGFFLIFEKNKKRLPPLLYSIRTPNATEFELTRYTTKEKKNNKARWLLLMAEQ
jgi:hypothetical protein